MIISPGFFLFLQNFDFLGYWEGQREKMAQNDKKILTLYLRNCTFYDCGFWYKCVKGQYLQEFFFFSFFQNSDFSGFSKFINKYQKEILSCAPPYSHVCNFLPKVRYTELHLYHSAHSYGCDQAQLVMPKVVSKIKSSVCHDRIEGNSMSNHPGHDTFTSQILFIFSLFVDIVEMINPRKFQSSTPYGSQVI